MGTEPEDGSENAQLALKDHCDEFDSMDLDAVLDGLPQDLKWQLGDASLPHPTLAALSTAATESGDYTSHASLQPSQRGRYTRHLLI